MRGLWQSIGTLFGFYPKNPKMLALSTGTPDNPSTYLTEHELATDIAATCLHARASERAVLQFDVKHGGQDNNEIAIRLQSLLDDPSPILSRVEFLQLCSLCYDGDGNLAILLVADPDGYPAEQWIIPGNELEPVFADKTNPVPTSWVTRRYNLEIMPENLVFLRRMSLRSTQYKGVGVLSDSRGSLELLKTIQRAQTNRMLNGGRPDVAMEFPTGVLISPEQAKDYQALWNFKFGTNGHTNVGFAPDGGKIVELKSAELNFKESRDSEKAAIREAFQTPRIILGDTDNVNHNNGQTAIAIFERTCVLRFGQALASAYQTAFRRIFGAGVTVEVSEFVVQSFTHLSQDNGVRTNEAVNA